MFLKNDGRLYHCRSLSSHVPLFAMEMQDVTQYCPLLRESRRDHPGGKAAFPKGNRYLRVRDAFGPLFHTPDFAHLFSYTGQRAEDPARLALVTILQFAERLLLVRLLAHRNIL